MSNPTISIRNVSKRYQLGNIGMTTLRDELQRVWARFRGDDVALGEKAARSNASEFWALRDVSFDVHQGDVLGLIGRNGAGKSTLLKLISRITEPTLGEIRLRGRVASLLEVGTGFHPELTGRENVFLNGTVLGMSRAEIRKKFDDIVEFSEIGNFIDTPVKRYSSGMYVRLAFAVAAQLEPEILIIDEVLAVGDVAFQQKCLNKVKEISNGQDRTVVFVSHNMSAVENICTRAVMLRAGQLLNQGDDVRQMVRQYLADQQPTKYPTWQNDNNEYVNDWFRVDRFFLANQDGAPILEPVTNDARVSVVIEGEVLKPDSNLQLGYGLFTDDMDPIYMSTNLDQPEASWIELQRGACQLTSQIPPRFLNEGKYRIALYFSLYRRKWICQPGVTGPMLSYEIRRPSTDTTSRAVRSHGLLRPEFIWHVTTPIELVG